MAWAPVGGHAHFGNATIGELPASLGPGIPGPSFGLWEASVGCPFLGKSANGHKVSDERGP